MSEVRLRTIGTLSTPFPEKFGVPRQAGVVPAAEGTLLLDDDLDAAYVRGLETFSHVWIVFLFHAHRHTDDSAARPTVRPPRLGGNVRVGSLASRSSHRPNPVGLSVCELVGVDEVDGRVAIRLRGVDMVDGTPVVDLKPYLAWADSHPAAASSWAAEPPRPVLEVTFAPDVAAACDPELAELVRHVVALDPRPGYRRHGGDRSADGTFGVALAGVNVRVSVQGSQAVVTAIQPLADGTSAPPPRP